MKEKWYSCLINYVDKIYIFLLLTVSVRRFFLHFLALLDWQFYRICFVIKVLKYAYTSASLMPRISGKIANCRI